MPEPLVSIVLANLNGARYLPEALRGILCQTFTNWELIAVDTGSTDGSPEYFETWAKKDPRVRPVLIKQLLNYPAAINLGLGLTRGAFIARVESDDVWLPTKLE